MVLLALALLLALPATTRGEQDAGEQAAALHRRGLELYEAGGYAEAIEQFRQAQALAPAPSNLFNIARCYERLGDLPGAIEHIEQYLADPALDAQRRTRGEQELARLRAATSAGAPPEDEGPPPDDTAEPSTTEPEPAPVRRLTWTAVGELAAGVAIPLVYDALGTAPAIGLSLGGGLNLGSPRQASRGVEVRPVRLEGLVGVVYEPMAEHVVEVLATGRLGVALGPLPVRVEGELALGLGTWLTNTEAQEHVLGLALIPAVGVSWQVLRWLELALRPFRLELLGLASDDVDLVVRLSMDVQVRFRY
jgi:tetratricopeptide (TPR) repeat protein